MKTIHLFYLKGNKNKKLLLNYLYQQFLKKDPSFFYCIEPDLIIRCENEKKIVAYLDKKGFKFDVYDYPNSPKNWMFDDSKTKNLKILIPIWHQLAVANLTLSHEEYVKVRERVCHLAVNMHFQDFFEEAYIFSYYAQRRLELALEERQKDE